MPSLGTVDQLMPIAASPPNLREDICGKNRRRQTEDADEEATAGTGDSGRTFLLSSLQSAPPHGAALLTSGLAAGIPPVEVYVGPTRPPGTVITNEPDPFPAAPVATKRKSATIAVGAKAAKPATAKPAIAAKPAAKPKPAAEEGPAPAAHVAVKPWPGDPPEDRKATDAKAKPAKSTVAAVAKPKPTVATAPKTEAQ
jgi:D-alanyl-D-alanine carboxypeptidase